MFLNPEPLPQRGPTVGSDQPLPHNGESAPTSSQLETLYRAQRPKLLRLLSRRTTPEHAQDIVQQVFARVAALSADRAGAIASPEAYLRRSATNVLRDDARVAVRRSTQLHGPDDEVELLAPDLIATLEARDMLNRLEAMMLRLKPKTREIFLAHRIDGYSYAEIAFRTGMSIKGVEKQMSKAIAHLDRCFGLR